MKKKFLAVLLAVSMLAGTGLAVPGNLTVQAEENETVESKTEENETVDAVGEDLSYLYLFSWQMKEDGTLEITSYTGDGIEVNIPLEINGKKVTSIGSRAFGSCDSLTNVYIPDTVTSIGELAFEDTQWLLNAQKENPLVIVNHILIDGRF